MAETIRLGDNLKISSCKNKMSGIEKILINAGLVASGLGFADQYSTQFLSMPSACAIISLGMTVFGIGYGYGKGREYERNLIRENKLEELDAITEEFKLY